MTAAGSQQETHSLADSPEWDAVRDSLNNDVRASSLRAKALAIWSRFMPTSRTVWIHLSIERIPTALGTRTYLLLGSAERVANRIGLEVRIADTTSIGRLTIDEGLFTSLLSEFRASLPLNVEPHILFFNQVLGRWVTRGILGETPLGRIMLRSSPMPDQLEPTALIDEIMRLMAQAPGGDSQVRQSLARLLAEHYKDGDVLTAQHMNLMTSQVRALSEAVRRLDSELKELRKQVPQHYKHTPGRGT